MKIAVDFDGTIVTHEYPKIGEPLPFAFETLKLLQEKHQLILWTYRTGKELEEAVEFCKKNGVNFYAVNKNYPEEKFDPETTSRKINADIYIDDRNLGGLPDWGEVYRMIEPDEDFNTEKKLSQDKGSIFKNFFRKRK